LMVPAVQVVRAICAQAMSTVVKPAGHAQSDFIPKSL